MKKKFNILALAAICALGCVISSCTSSEDNEGETPTTEVPDVGGGIITTFPDNDGDGDSDNGNPSDGTDGEENNDGDEGSAEEQVPDFDTSTLSGRFNKFIYDNGKDLTKIDLSQTTDQFSVAELMTIAYNQFAYYNENSTLYTLSRAESPAMTSTNIQITGTAWLKRGDKIFKENTSKNNLNTVFIFFQTYVHFSERIYNYNANSGTYVDGYGYDYYRDPDLNNSSFNTNLSYYANYSSYGPTNYSDLSAFRASYYLNPTYPSNYVFMNDDCTTSYVDENASDTFDSILDSTTYDYKTSIELTNDSTYTVHMALSSEAYADYAEYMMTTTTDQGGAAKMTSEPTFDYVLLKFTLDRSLKIIDARVREKYYVNVDLAKNTETNAESIYLFDYEDDSAIPDLSTVVNYSTIFSEYLSAFLS